MRTKEEFLEMLESGNLDPIVKSTSGQLSEDLPAIREALAEIQQHKDDLDERIKTFQGAKAEWAERDRLLKAAILESMTGDGVKSVSAPDGSTATVSTRNSLTVDDKSLLEDFKEFVETFRVSLPSWVKVTVGIDKTALAAAVKEDASLLAEKPEALHYEETQVVTIKGKTASKKGDKASAA